MKKLFLLPLALAILALLSACASATPAPQPTPTLPPVATTAPLPSATPLPTAIPSVLLVVADQNQPDVTEAARAIERDLRPLPAGAQEVNILTALAPDRITPEVKAVIILSPVDNLEALVAAAPTIPFVAVSGVDVPAHPNLSVIRLIPENQAYLAGFITSVISPDWRSAGLLPPDPASLQQAFANGASYYCGHCTPINGPIVLFPLVAGTTAQNAQAELAKMKASLPETLYIDAAVASADLLTAAETQKLVLLGGQSPADRIQANWAVTIRPDLLGALKTLWPDLTAGKGGKTIVVGFTFSDINPQLFSPGKQRLAQDVIDRLAEGSLVPLSPN